MSSSLRLAPSGRSDNASRGLGAEALRWAFSADFHWSGLNAVVNDEARAKDPVRTWPVRAGYDLWPAGTTARVIRTERARRGQCSPDLQLHGILHVMRKTIAVRESVQRYRERMQRAGFRLVQLRVPDTGARGYAEECRRQSRAAARNRRAETEAMMWIEASEDTEAWTA